MNQELVLELDLGQVGNRFRREPFRVTLDASPLRELIDHSHLGHRIYELMLIARLGDVWDYVLVRPIELPGPLLEQCQRLRAEAQRPYETRHPRPDDCLTLLVFDAAFDWHGPDPEEVDIAWTKARQGRQVTDFGLRLLNMARGAQWASELESPLEHHEMQQIRSQHHPLDQLSRQSAIARSRELPPEPQRHQPGFYKQLQELLKDGELASVSYRGAGDYAVVHALCVEQRRRATRTRRAPRHALALNGLLDRHVRVEHWGAEFLFRDSGLDLGDLHIEEACPVRSVTSLLERTTFRPRYVLTETDQGPLDGYGAESADGWTLYRHTHPLSRRANLERLWRSERLTADFGIALHFGQPGQLVLERDQALVMVGEAVDISTRKALAEAISDWQAHEGDCLLVVLGDTTPFTTAGCQDLHPWPTTETWANADHPGHWLAVLMAEERRWLDVALLLGAPDWAIETVLMIHPQRNVPWGPWIAATPNCPGLSPDFTLEGDPAAVLEDAHGKARRLRR